MGNAAQYGFDLTGADVGVQPVERRFAVEQRSRAAEPVMGLGALTKRDLGFLDDA